ncbi:Polysaccharide biosynthesis protein [Rhodovastum atsumiense]|uniref:Polysaccharide biosynthesis protein n=1 Tax=Rhodovastum atsumiense TaxID=504468 RepID=A0A5M6IZ98_9PROT|nr:nucleoside-diphosphate sugar epimerase/dehydratase [Rhodovastum atsumiense]KAA5613662.1 polysaccharide biosynthesis protein [Rhodovastum atsumiense]CAH2599573.1 Polysaccharide biosynthesis protein [Rhodovastum atsumiense]
MATRTALFRIGLNVGVDALLAGAAVPLAHWLANPLAGEVGPLWTVPWGAMALLLAGLPFRLPTQYWRFAGAGDLLGVAAASIAAAAIYPIALHEAGLPFPSPAFPALHAMTLMVLLSVPRVGYRLMRESPDGNTGPALPVLLVGAGESAALFIRALAADRSQPYRVTGLLSLGKAQTGRRIDGYPILGALTDAPAVLARLRAGGRLPTTLVVTEADITGDELTGLMEAADREGLRVARAPRLTALDPAGAGAQRLELRPLALEDLLNRPQVPLDREGMARLVQGRRVLVTGAGGTIGSELARQVAALGPELLILLDNGEFALWQIEVELAESHPGVARRTVLADVRDEARIRGLMEALRPELVFHAAALKHVPMVESHPLEGLLTNAAGTRNVADAARAVGVRAMVLISTDKAVNPSSVMGASKRLAEMYCQGLDIAARGPAGGMRCVTVRFGNVLGSTGSVVPLFQRQLARGGPLTVTHPDMRRYFMTVREAVGLVLQASVVGTTAPDLRDGGIFVLDMGAPVKIVDLARQMIRLAGLRPEVDVEIRFTGLRPGEKLFEELFHGKEPATQTGYPGLLMALPRTADPAIVGRTIDEIAAACRAGNHRTALAVLGRVIPEFEHNAEGQVLAGGQA